MRAGVKLGRRGSIILLLLMGILFSGFGYFMFSYTLDKINNGIAVIAKVTDIETNRSDKQTVYTPVIEFITGKGEVIRTKLDLSSTSSTKYSIGDEVVIYYSPENPNDVLLDNKFNEYGFPSIFLLAGVIMFVLGVVKIFKPNSNI